MVAPARRVQLSRPVSFAAAATIFVWFLAASSAPSPLYVVYQQQFTFTEFTLTLVFAVYVIALIAALLVVGALSDHIGRRPVLFGALALEIVAMVLFLTADGVGMLLLARIVQGVATGAATSVLPATLVDLDPPHARGRAGLINGIAPQAGLGFGALGCGALVQFAPAPTRLVWVLLLIGMVVAAIVVALMSETISRRPGALASLRPRVGVPPRIRGEFGAIVPVLMASWALGGLYLSLGPSVAAGLFGLHNHLVGGLVVTLLCAPGALTSFLIRRGEPSRALAPAAVGLGLGTLITLAGIWTGSTVVAAVGTVVAGVGFGAAAFGMFGTLARIAAPHERGELFATAYTAAYLSFSVPAVIAGLAATTFGLQATAEVYGLVVVALTVFALVVGRVVAARRRRADAGGRSEPLVDDQVLDPDTRGENPRTVDARTAPREVPAAMTRAPAAGVLVGRLQSAAGPIGVDGVVTVTDAQGRQVARTTAAGGEYALCGLPPGTYTAVASAPGFRPAVSAVTLNGAGLVRDFALDGNGLMTGTTTGVDGSRLAGALVIATDARGHVVGRMHSGTDGTFQVAGLPSGPTTVAASHPDHEPTAVTVDVALSATSVVELVLGSSSGLLSGVVAGPDGIAFAGATVTALGPRGDVVASVRSDAAGEYVFFGLPAGDYTVVASAYAPVTTLVAVLAGEAARVDLRLGDNAGARAELR